ncbi:ABC transporter permease [Brachybacterium aquaticum]|uniref:Transport permease protein n=1 Tax=Brachybacterium aquaticum TaxID=1432564 RepID=A0A841AAW8_9MICO|nr:ABC transporter permease [Brachybacterium aquaticum]MBB5830380.1 teichoic acid transport system permease protein [Brachybacterium aquaticum]
MTIDEASSVTVPRPPEPIERVFSADSLAVAVDRNDLEQIGVRPRLGAYVRDTWAYRSLIHVMAVSKAEAENQNTYLGQVWSLISPMINALVYVLIFGFLLRIGREGIENTIAFIVVGVFMFRFFERSVMAGSHSLGKNMSLVRSVQFPRAVLPMAGVLAELAMLGPALIVMCVISYLSGLLPMAGRITIDGYWLLLIPAVLLLWLFSTGCAFIAARLVAVTPDIDNLLPHFLRILMYASGVIFSVERYLSQFSWGWIMEYQPVAVYLYLVRSSILDEPAYPPDAFMWLLGVAWAVVVAVVGFLYFWAGEERYGRD